MTGASPSPAQDAVRDADAREARAREGVRELLSSIAAPAEEKRANRRGQQTRDKLVEAAAACFSEYGYSRTRVSDITSRADTAQGNFYRHFGSIDEIFIAALQPGLEDLATASSRRRLGDDEDALVDHLTTYLNTYARHRHLLRVMREAAATSDNEGFATLWMQMRAGFVERTERWLRRLRAEGRIEELADTELHAEALGAMLEQMAYVHVGLSVTGPRPERINAIARTLASIWYRSLPHIAAPDR